MIKIYCTGSYVLMNSIDVTMQDCAVVEQITQRLIRVHKYDINSMDNECRAAKSQRVRFPSDVWAYKWNCEILLHYQSKGNQTRMSYELTSKSLHESFINSHVLVKREQELHESWQARVYMRISSTLMSWSNENKSCTRADKREFTREFINHQQAKARQYKSKSYMDVCICRTRIDLIIPKNLNKN